MKFLKTALLFSMWSCGVKLNNQGGPIGVPDKKGFIPVARAIITVSKNDYEVTRALDLLKYLNPIKMAYAQAVPTTVVYVAADNANLELDVTALVPNLSLDGNTLSLGSVTVTDLSANKLKICGMGGNQKCTQAVIRAYTTELVGFEGISGFVNKTDSYGVPVLAGPVTANGSVGLDSANSTILQSYTIPANRNKIDESHFSDLNYVVSADFDNAGFGNYEMTLVIELAVGL